jgi:trimethylamine--corrinoid protein Co-methyltransferase
MAYSSPDKTLLSFGLGQMAKRYRLPCLVADIGFGDEFEGNIGAFGDVVVQCMGIPSQTDIMTGMGCVDSAKGICFEQLVIDAYIWEFVRGFMKDVEVTEERIGLDAMEAVGPGNHFLKSPHTIRYMREEVTQWDQRKVKMLSTDPATMCKEFRAIANQLLEDHKVLPIDEDLVRQGDEIIQAYERALAA